MGPRDFLILTGVCLVWSLNVVASKIVVDDLSVPPLLYATLRSAVVVIALLPWLLPRPRPTGRLVVAVFLLGSGSFALFFIGLETTDPSTAGVVSLLGAPLTAIFAIFVLGERIHWRRGLGIVLTFAGVTIALWSPTGLILSWGVIAIALSTLGGAIGAIMLKRLPDISPLRLQAWSGLTGTLILFPLTGALELDAIPAGNYGWELLLILAFSALVVSVGAHSLYFRMLQKYEANLVAPLTLMTPIFTITLGHLITRDGVGPTMIIGSACAIAGVFIIAVRPSLRLPKAFMLRRAVDPAD